MTAPSRFAVVAYVAFAAVASACTPAPGPADARGAAPAAERALVTVAEPSPSTTPSPEEAGASSPTIAATLSRCPIVPMRLTVEAFGQKPIPMLSLSADGRVDVVTMGGPALRARLDPRGCLVGPDGPWAELTRAGTLWTAHELLETEGPTIRLADGAALRIRPDGTVVRIERDGRVEPNAHGTLRLAGYREDASCPGLLLLGAFLAMMPSMAVADGNPAMAPVPPESACNEFRR